MLYKVAMEIQPLLYQRKKKLSYFNVCYSAVPLRRFLSDRVVCFCNGAYRVHHSVKAGKGPAANIV